MSGCLKHDQSITTKVCMPQKKLIIYDIVSCVQLLPFCGNSIPQMPWGSVRFLYIIIILSCLWTRNCNHGPALCPNICRVWHGYILLMNNNSSYYRKRHCEVLVFFAEHGHKPTNLPDPKNSQCFYVPLTRLLFLLLLFCLLPFANEEN